MAFTYFFRDAQTLELMIDEALPALRGQAFIHVWDAGCAHGPEPYTLAILLRERMSDFTFRNVRIHATDLDAQFGPQVASGVYPEQQVKRIPQTYLRKYFRPGPEAGTVQVVDEIRAKLSFAPHNLLTLAPPREDFSLIVCKNVLLHFDEAQRRSVFQMFHRALRPGGLLATEHTQKLPAGLDGLLTPVASYAQIFRRLDAPHSAQFFDGPHAAAGRALREAQAKVS